MNYIKLISLSFMLLIFGCGESSKDTITNVDNPEVVAIEFFNALYNEQNIKKAASVCSPKLARIILHYKSTKAVARHMFNMSFDNVEITPDDSGVKVREQFKNSAVITVYFDGYYQNNHLKDVKRLSLIQVEDKWIIDKILKDPF
ncbi:MULTISPECIES: hypothetical protein [unclassified Colwellia]|uniref:hypothetical protein n=1 Tax=unclassified Colwellia TaxID=196834 RepID=UPI000D37E018|nr:MULTISPECIES: hypothetical protein [unclassified Colwellia]AWB57995.1 hypothetical protein DBO93_10720 [Colwellia sp. Arc7-D]MBA6417075.1 hypothetical protein [Colwellia sp. 6M3]|tara:strand:+ start:2644 stop:3078 length:435 start_codon:yes stop_codon:yes gene_type:complete